MSIRRIKTSIGVNYRGQTPVGTAADPNGMNLVGWDSGVIRIHTYRFETGAWPVTHIAWNGPPVYEIYKGSAIPINILVTRNQPAYNTYGSGSRLIYELGHAPHNEINVNLEPNGVYYLNFIPALNRGVSPWGLNQIGYKDGDTDNISLDITEESYSNCTAPTVLTLNKSIQIPNQNVTLSWSGAKAGSNLTIAGYDIYRSTSSTGTFEKINGDSIITGTSYTVTAPSIRGDYYYYKVKAISSVAGYDSELSNVSNGLKANMLPSSPTVTVDRSIIPSTGGNVTFTVIPGTDSDGQVQTLAYATSSGGTKTTFTSPLKLSYQSPVPGTTLTYYFYTYDSLEYSNAFVQSITINVKPEISLATYADNSIGFYRALMDRTGIAGYQLGYAKSITPRLTTNKTGNISVTTELEYYSSNNNETTQWDSTGVTLNHSTIQQLTVNSISDTAFNLSNFNISPFVTLESTNLHWRLRFKINDGIEDSDFAFYPSENSKEYYAIAHLMQVGNSGVSVYNTNGNSNIIGTNSQEVYQKMRLRTYEDELLTPVSATASVNNVIQNITFRTGKERRQSDPLDDPSSRFVDITLLDEVESEARIDVTIYFSDSSNHIFKSLSFTVTETKAPTISNLSHGAPTIKPFTDTGSFDLVTIWPFGEYSTIDATTLRKYNCSTTVSQSIKLVYSSKNNEKGSNRYEVPGLAWTKNNDNIVSSLNRESAYAFNNTIGIFNYRGEYTYYCRFEIVNLFGKTYCTEWVPRIFNFNEYAQSPTITSIQWAKNNTSSTVWTTLGANDKLQEGMYLKFNCEFGLYTKDDMTVSIIREKNSQRKAVYYKNYKSYNLTRATDRNVASNSVSYVYKIDFEIDDSYDRDWYISIDNTMGNAISQTPITTSVLRQCKPNFTLVTCTYGQTQNEYFDYTYNFSDIGFDNNGTLTSYLCDNASNDGSQGKTELTQALTTFTVGTGIQGTKVSKQSQRNWEAKSVSVKMKSVVTGLVTNTKYYYSNAILVYKILPTVAYKKNRIGINTKTPQTDAILDIHQSTNEKYILVQGLNSDSTPKPTKFVMNVTTGEIEYWVDGIKQHTLNLLNGTIT